MKYVDMITGRCIEAAEMAAALTRNKQIYDGVIVELAVIPAGIEVRGVKYHNDEVISHTRSVISWELLRDKSHDDYLESAVLEVGRILSSKGK